ncbi:MAG: hypothetical protein GMKNLPBB_00223 [Myxococcota bacterium]|nr:hypothetical protein [Myxococcota bacterium]
MFVLIIVALALAASGCDAAKESYQQAEVIANTGEVKEAIRAYQQVIDNHKDSQYADKARAKLVELHVSQAKKAQENAKPDEVKDSYELALSFASGDAKAKLEKEKAEAVDQTERSIIAGGVKSVFAKADAVEITPDRSRAIVWKPAASTDLEADKIDAVGEVLGRMDLNEQIFKKYITIKTLEVKVFRLDQLKNERMEKFSFSIQKDKFLPADRKDWRDLYSVARLSGGTVMSNPEFKKWWDTVMPVVEKGPGW